MGKHSFSSVILADTDVINLKAYLSRFDESWQTHAGRIVEDGTRLVCCGQSGC